MAGTAMMRRRAISPDAGKRVDYRMVSIDTFLSVGTASARILGAGATHRPTAEGRLGWFNRWESLWSRVRSEKPPAVPPYWTGGSKLESNPRSRFALQMSSPPEHHACR